MLRQRINLSLAMCAIVLVAVVAPPLVQAQSVPEADRTHGGFYSLQLRGLGFSQDGQACEIYVWDNTYDQAAYGQITILDLDSGSILFSKRYGDYGVYGSQGTIPPAGDTWDQVFLPRDTAVQVQIRGQEFSRFSAMVGTEEKAGGGTYNGGYPSWTGYFNITSTVVPISDLAVYGANHFSCGDFGTSTRSMDPLFDIDSPLSGYFRTGGTETFGNNVETQAGWESTQTWEPYQLADGSWKVGKGFDAGTILKGQYSRVGTKPGNLALFGVGFVNDAEWRTRDLETYSSGSVQLQNVGTSATQVDVELDFNASINGSALEKSSAVAINLIPTVVSAVATAGGELLEQKLLEGLVKSQAQKWVGIQTQLVTEKSDFSGSANMQLELLQDGQVVGTMDVASPEFAPDSVEARYGGYVIKTTRRVSGETSVVVDPTKPLEYRLDIDTHAGALGTGQAYMGVPYYKLQFSTPGVASVPLVVERRDPAGDPENPKALLYGTVSTPELVDGDVQLVDDIGPYAAQTDEKLVTFTNAATSGFTMPVSLLEGDDTLELAIASLASSESNLDQIGVQIGYTTGDEFHSLFDDTLANLFAYGSDSGLAGMPFASDWVELGVDISSLPRGDQMLLFAFGDLSPSGVDSTLVMESFGVVPEPATVGLLAVGGLALLRRRRAA